MPFELWQLSVTPRKPLDEVKSDTRVGVGVVGVGGGVVPLDLEQINDSLNLSTKWSAPEII